MDGKRKHQDDENGEDEVVYPPTKQAKQREAVARARAHPYAKTPVVTGLGTPGGKPFRYFNSKVGLQRLSNFAKLAAPMHFRGNQFLTSEHACQSQKVHPGDVWRFAIDGDLGDIRGFRQFMESETAEKKITWWGKGAVSMDGVVAKMVVNPEHNKKLKTPLRLRRLAADGDIEAQSVLWRAILMAKARADPQYRDILEFSGDALLVEFDRGAKRAVSRGRNPFWTGLVDKESGDLFGSNFMGVCQMRNRERLAEWF